MGSMVEKAITKSLIGLKNRDYTSPVRYWKRMTTLTGSDFSWRSRLST